MLKYLVVPFLIVGAILFYAFFKDPCHQQARADFSNKYPDYRILSSDAAEGSPESVRCQISYRKPDGGQVYEETWLYQNLGSGWEFSKILETREREQTP